MGLQHVGLAEHLLLPGQLSAGLPLLLLLDRGERQTPAITRLRTFATWFSSNDLDSVTKEEIQETIEFDDFTTEELATEVKESGLYPTDKIIAKMLENFESKSKKLEATLADKEAILKIHSGWLKHLVMEKNKLEEKNKILNSGINLLQDSRLRMLAFCELCDLCFCGFVYFVF